MPRGRFIDLTGQVLGDLEVLERAENGRSCSGVSIVQFRCRCRKCGTETVKRADSLRRGKRCYACARAEVGARQRTTRNPKWGGGRKKSGSGYVAVKDPNSPMANASGYVLEHRLVMAKALGRPLRKDEVVHHRNGVKTDNRIENLELLSNAAHSTLEWRKRWQELKDLRAEVAELRERLARYEAVA